MSAEIWFIIAIVSFSLSGIALIAAVLMFIKLNIPAVIGDLSGKTVAREIKAMRDANASSGTKIHRSSAVNANRSKLTQKMKEPPITPSAQVAAHASHDLTGVAPVQAAVETPPAKQADVLDAGRQTDVLDTGRQTDVLDTGRQTDVLDTGRQTEVLSPIQQTEVLSPIQQTEVLADNQVVPAVPEGTTVLSQAADPAPSSGQPVAFRVTRSIVQTQASGVPQ